MKLRAAYATQTKNAAFEERKEQKKKQQLSEAHHVSRFIQVRKFSTQNWKKNIRMGAA